MENLQAKELFRKYQQGTCSDDELELIRYSVHHFREQSESGLTEYQLNEVANDLWEKIESQTFKKHPVRMLLWRKIAAVAAILLLLMGWLLIMQSRKNEVKKFESVYRNDIDPGRDQAYLVLADGKRVNLDSVSSGTIEQPGVRISKTKDGMLVYQIDSDNPTDDQTNTLETPRGGRFQIKLPDGTNVWLNAASKLVYPLSFKGKGNRVVDLSGEAYFEVAHDQAHPFLVQSADQTVQVLGTHFNVQAYSDESYIRTTLLTGAIKISAGSRREAKFLKPGEEADYSSQHITVVEADTERAVAWFNDDFVFSGEDLKSVMRQIARWYDVEVTFVGNPGNAAFYSTLSRKKKLSDILKALTMNQGIHFKLEGRRVTVMQ